MTKHAWRYVLSELVVVNWGPFSGTHVAHIDPEGSAIVGETGSGKTTLVDALMTLLTERPRYNLASTGGLESDRDLMSYIRGASGSGNQEDNTHIARTGNTITGISATFTTAPNIQNGLKTSAEAAQRITIAGIFWIDSTSNAAADRKDLWLVDEQTPPPETEEPSLHDALNIDAPPSQSLFEPPLLAWLMVLQESGSRGLKKALRESNNTRVFDTKKAYLAKIRRLFAVGDNAFTLLNRATGLKQLSSVNDIFRQLVLEDESAFDEAASVVSQFQNLQHIHEELARAQRQESTLKPIHTLNQAWEHSQAEENRLSQIHELLPLWFARQAAELWGAKVTESKQRLAQLHGTQETIKQERTRHEQTRDDLQQRYLQLGGGNEQALIEQISMQNIFLAQTKQKAEHFRLAAAQLGQPEPALHAEALRNVQSHTESMRQTLEQARQTQQEAFHDCIAKQISIRQALQRIQTELEDIRTRPNSNIPSPFHAWRSQLADVLGLAPDALPFLAELVEVQANEAHWRGAIERAMGNHRLRLVVPEKAIDAALKWVNQRNNQLNISLFHAGERQSNPKMFEDSFIHKLNFKEHPHQQAARSMLASLDRHCVHSIEALKQTAHAMTQEGLMSQRRGWFDKRDKTPLNGNWMTGFSNHDRMAELEQKHADKKSQLHHLQTHYNDAKKLVEGTERQLKLIDDLASLSFKDIDVPSQQQALALLETKLEALRQPDSDLAKARAQLSKIQNQLDALTQKHDAVTKEIGNEEGILKRAQSKHQTAQKHAQAPIDQASWQQIQDHMQIHHQAMLANMNAETLAQAETQTAEHMHAQRDKARKRTASGATDLIQQMNRAQKEAPGELLEVGTDLEDIPAYLACLRRLQQEDLPNKRQRFLDYLNTSSDQGVSALIDDIQNKVHVIESRITELNETLKKVDFKPDTCLQLDPTPVKHQNLRDFELLHKRLRQAALSDDEGHEHYRALHALVMHLSNAVTNKRTQGARALLDPRHRLTFSVSIRNRHDGRVLEKRSDSRGDSGGEKEIITSYLLIASLSYALSPEAGHPPIFATVVLDEAFSRTSQAVAARIVQALREFHLHPLFVTPNKELALLRTHTRSAVVVSKPGKHAALTSLAWEELDAHRQSRSHPSKAPNHTAS